MVLAKVPITPQWNLNKGCVCTPDGGFLYVGSRSINYVGPSEQEEGETEGKEPIIKVFHTRQTILGVDIDPGWPTSVVEDRSGSEVVNTITPGGQQKYFAALAQDNSVQIWDFDRGCAISGHKAHFSTALYMEGNGPSPQSDHVLFSYMRNRNVLSVNTQDLVVYCVASNTYCRRQMFVSFRNQTLTVLSCSPHSEHIFAVGTSRGLVVIADLQRMNTLYTLRGHDASITALSWCPPDGETLQRRPSTKDNVETGKLGSEPQKQEIPKIGSNNNSKLQKSKKLPMPPVSNDDIFDIYDYDYLEKEFGAPVETKKKIDDSVDDFSGLEKTMGCGSSTNFNFAEACQSLKEEIDALKQEQSKERPTQMPDVTLADCQKVGCANDGVSSYGEGSNDSTEGSLDIPERSSSDDGICVDGGEAKLKQQILHQAEVHAEQTNEMEKKEVNITVLETDECKEENKSIKLESIENDNVQIAKPENHTAHVEDLASESKSPKFSNNVRSDVLLASAGIDGSFWIWNTKSGASCDNVRPHNSGKYGKNTSIHIAWLSQTQFLTTNKAGELSFWSLVPSSVDSPSRQHRRYKYKEEKQYQFHQRNVVAFTLANKCGLLWCVSSHREISCENLESGKLLLKYCCSSTNVSAMRECPDDMNKIALAFSDRRVGIIDISKMSATKVFIENYVSRVDASVLSLVWSPDSKRLAFGTLEGRVGIIHIEASKPTITFNPFCGKPVYSMDWHGDHIFVVCNDILAVYDDSTDTRDAHIIREVQSVSSVSVRGDQLYVGTQRGHLQVFHRNLNIPYSYVLRQDVPLAPRYITEISWSPIATDHVAVVANANNIHILKSNAIDGLLTPLRRIEIKNLKAANACVKWSNHTATEFLTCGFDGGIRVWDLNCTTNDEKFLKQFPCPMTCGLFLPTDEQVLMCAGKSTSIELLDMRVEESMVYSSAKWKRSNTHALDYVKWALKVGTRLDVTKPLTVTEKRRAKRAPGGGNERVGVVVGSTEEAGHDSKFEVADMFGSLTLNEATKSVSPEKGVVDEQHVAKKKENKVPTSMFMKNPATLLYLTTKELNKDVLEKLNIALTRSGTNNLLCTKLFGTKEEAQQLLTAELKNHKQSETLGISSLFIPQLNSSIRDEILNCIQRKQLSEWHVAISPTISYGFWQKCCQAFADQLLEQGYALQAATYIIAMHRQYEAIEMLMSKHFYKEALLIGRIYLQREDPLLSTITDKWISHLDINGNLTGSALLCVLSGQMNRAYETLAKVRNVHPEIERVLEKMQIKQNVNQ